MKQDGQAGYQRHQAYVPVRAITREQEMIAERQLVAVVLEAIAGRRLSSKWAALKGWIGQKARDTSVLINLIFFFSISILLLALIFVVQKQRIIQAARPPIPQPKIVLRRKARVSRVSSTGAPEKAIKAVTVYTHDRAAAERLLQSYGRTHSHKGWDGVVEQVIRDLVRDRR